MGAPIVTGPPGLCFYAGTPLIAPSGHRIGSLCVLDDRPHQEFAAHNLRILRDLAATAIELLEARSRQIELARCSRELAHLAGHDPLTGLPNRRLFHNRVEDAAAARAPGDEVAMLYLDLDGFKAVNDTLGHEAGDTLLRGVADRLRASVRDGDIVARLGGDEFAIVLRTGPRAAQQAADFAARLIPILSAPYMVEGHPVSVGVSIGVALGGNTREPDALLRDADAALYEAKSGGRGTFRIHEPVAKAA